MFRYQSAKSGKNGVFYRRKNGIEYTLVRVPKLLPARKRSRILTRTKWHFDYILPYFCSLFNDNFFDLMQEYLTHTLGGKELLVDVITVLKKEHLAATARKRKKKGVANQEVELSDDSDDSTFEENDDTSSEESDDSDGSDSSSESETESEDDENHAPTTGDISLGRVFRNIALNARSHVLNGATAKSQKQPQKKKKVKQSRRMPLQLLEVCN
jgi:hypothetical protein